MALAGELPTTAVLPSRVMNAPMFFGLTAIAVLAPQCARADVKADAKADAKADVKADVKADAKADAKAAYQQGAAHFKARRYAQALSSFEQAFKLDPSPVLLYNIARCAEEMGDVERARTNFEWYLARLPNAADRTDVQRRIRVMQAVADRNRAAPTDPPYLAYSLVGTGVAAVAIGAFLGAKAGGLDDDYTAEIADARRKQVLGDDAGSTALWANVAYGVGGALLVGGAIIWLLDAPAAPVSAFIGPETVGIHGHF
jgi:tetratricopeptide (TPR) repeat protein